MSEIGNSPEVVRVIRHPVHPLFAPFPIACFLGAFLTDVAYYATAEMMWADFSAWLLAAGVILSLLVLIAGLVETAMNRRLRAWRSIWRYEIAVLVMAVLGILNSLVHSRDAWTSVVPQGLILSTITLVVALVVAWLGSAILRRYHVGAAV